MNEKGKASILQQTKSRFKEIVEKNRLLDASVSVLAKPLTPEEAIGTPGRRDFPIIIGKERVVESSVLGSKGHAFTDSPREFVGTLKEVLGLELTTNQNRAIYVATLNAVLGHLEMVTATVHCRDEDPEECALEIANLALERYGRADIGLIGLNPAIAERLVETFGAEHVRISDLNGDNIGKRRFGVEIRDGNDGTEELIDASDVIVFTGTSLVNGTFDRIWSHIRTRGKNYLVYGVTAAGVSKLMGVERICPRGRL
jgi:uncharacterized protein (DUF4213/DUF364 family)